MNGRGVIFDMDGVLVDSYHAHFESFRIFGSKHGIEVTEPMFAKQFGRTSREIFRDWIGGHLTDEDVRTLDAEKELAYREILQRDFPAMDGIGELLAALHAAGFKMAVGSSGPPKNIEVVLRLLPGGQYIDVKVSGMDVHIGKPHPEVFQLAAAKMGLDPRNCVVVEDAPVGVAAGKAAGAAVVAITGTAEHDKLAAADLIVDSHRELSPVIFAELIEKNLRRVPA